MNDIHFRIKFNNVGGVNVVNGVTGRRERKKTEVRDKIINSALKVFLEKGFNETTIADIMEDADLGTGTFYNYFQSKEDLVTYCVGEIVSDAKVEIEKIKDKTLRPSEKISQILLAVGEVFEKNRFLMGLFIQLRRTSQSSAKLPSHDNIFRQILADVFKQGQEAGEFEHTIPTEAVVEMIFGMLQSSLMSRDTSVSFSEKLTVKLKIFFEGVLTKTTDKKNERNEASGDKNS